MDTMFLMYTVESMHEGTPAFPRKERAPGTAWVSAVLVAMLIGPGLADTNAAQAANPRPLQVRAPAVVGNEVRVDVSGDASTDYLLEQSADLKNWARVGSGSDPSGIVKFRLPAAQGSAGFWRARTAVRWSGDFSENLGSLTTYAPLAAFGIAPRIQTGGGVVSVESPVSPLGATLPATVGLLRTNIAWADFEARVDFTGWSSGSGTNVAILLGGRLQADALGSLSGYLVRVSPADWTGPDPSGGAASPATLCLQPFSRGPSFFFPTSADIPPLSPTNWYRLTLRAKGDLVYGGLELLGDKGKLISELAMRDTNYARAGGVGVVAMDFTGAAGAPGVGVKATFDNLDVTESIPDPVVPTRFVTGDAPWSDDFADGDLAGWSAFEPVKLLGGPSSVAVKDGAMNLAAGPMPLPLAPSTVGAYRSVGWTNFAFSAEVTGWKGDPEKPYLMLVGRASGFESGAVNGIGARIVTDTGAGMANVSTYPFFIMDVWQNSRLTGPYARAMVPLPDPTRRYKIELVARGTQLIGTWYGPDDLTSVTARWVGYLDPATVRGGALGVAEMDRWGYNQQGNQAVRGVWDNVVMSVLP